MTPQITPFGLVLISPLYYLAGRLLVALWRRMQPSPWRWGLLAFIPFVVVLPFADELWITWNFERYCKEAGVKVVRKVEVEGFYDDTMPSGFELINRYGYRVMEHRASDGKTVERVEKNGEKWERTILEHAKARYHYRYANPRQWVPAGYQINRMERQVFDSVTGEVIGRQITFERYPGFIEGLWLRFLGSGQIMCPDPGGPLQPAFPESILIPKRN